MGIKEKGRAVTRPFFFLFERMTTNIDLKGDQPIGKDVDFIIYKSTQEL